jgi:cell surface protein SprA
MMFNAVEQVTYQDFLNRNRDSSGNLDPDIDPNDPSGDDYAYKSQTIDFTRINGTEGNKDIRRDPDTEDMNRTNNIDPENEYVEYEIPLDTLYYDSLNNLVKNPYIVGGNLATGWYQLRIPLTDPNRVIGGLSTETALSNVKFMRMWVSVSASRSSSVSLSSILWVINGCSRLPAIRSLRSRS